jgi:hypothetical protein
VISLYEQALSAIGDLALGGVGTERFSDEIAEP